MNVENPKTLLEAVRHFSDLLACDAYMIALKWPDSRITCPKCGGEHVGRIASRRLLQCKAAGCRKQFSAKVGTIFEDSPLGLDKWLPVVWAVANDFPTTSAVLAETLGVTIKSAWRMRKVVKLAMRTPTFQTASEGVGYRLVPDWPAYRVGSDGSLWTRWRKGPGARIGETWKPMRARLDREGYRNVELVGEGGERVHRKVGAIVLRAFVGPPPEGQECRHLDGESANDALTNLAWGTPLENHADKRRHGTIACGATHGKVKLSSDQICALLALKGTMSQRQAADQYGVSRGYVGQLWSGNRKRVEV